MHKKLHDDFLKNVIFKYKTGHQLLMIKRKIKTICKDVKQFLMIISYLKQKIWTQPLNQQPKNLRELRQAIVSNVTILTNIW